MDIDDFRDLLDDDEESSSYEGEDELPFEVGTEIASTPEQETLFLGMTAAQRMLVALMLFLNVLVIGLGLLLVTGRLAF